MPLSSFLYNNSRFLFLVAVVDQWGLTETMSHSCFCHSLLQHALYHNLSVANKQQQQQIYLIVSSDK